MHRDLVDDLNGLIQVHASDDATGGLLTEVGVAAASALIARGQRGDLERAAATLAAAARHARSTDHRRSVALALLGLADTQIGVVDPISPSERIERTLQLAAALAPAEALPALAGYVERAGRMSEAVEIWQRLLTLPEPHTTSQFLQLAHLQEQAGDLAGALATYLRLLDAVPAHSDMMLVGQRIDALVPRLPAPSTAEQISIALLGNASMEQLRAHLVVECVRAGLRPAVYEAGFDQYTHTLLSPQSDLYAFAPDVTVLAIHASRLLPGIHDDPLTLSVAERRAEIDAAVGTVRGLLDAFSERCAGLLLLHTLVAPRHPVLGILDWRDDLGQTAAIHEVNGRLAQLVRDHYPNVHLVDEDRVQAGRGKDTATDARLWYAARMPWSAAVLTGLAQEYLRYIRPLKGLSRKCVVLDLDNTLWGGIIGEDGLSGIQLGSDAPGNAFVALQRELERLWRRGILLAVCSKNNEDEAWAVFDQHPDMVLKRSHFAAARINWRPKSENLRSLADELNLGLNSFVFLDDNPRECEEVHGALPQVLTVCLPPDPALYRETLLRLNVFDTLSLTQEDLDRNRLYAERRQRQELQAAAGDAASMEGYLASLGIIAEIAPAEALSIPRVAQLTNKTNQFNVTTRRYSEAQIVGVVERGWPVYALRVRDRFGDEGLVGVAILAPGDAGVWEIDTLLMSCRVIGRGVETALLAHIAAAARQAGASRLVGRFLPTGRNGLVSHLFEQHGFALAERGSAGAERWELDITTQQIAVPAWIDLRTPAPTL
ncbi:MAG: HAD family hydrolase [Chloroflexi bacterium]|nr:HAD family hydrolase [Chloroflexota bacterium]